MASCYETGCCCPRFSRWLWYAMRLLIAAGGMCIVIVAILIVLPLVPFDRGHK